MEQQSALTRRYGRFRFLRFGKRQKFFLIWVILWQCAALRAQINTDAVTWMGRNALGVDDYLTAIHYFNQVIEVKPYLSRPYYYRAYAKFTLEDYSGAEQDCTRAIELNPFLIEPYQLRGLCRIHNRDFKGAIHDYDRVLQEEPSDQGALYNRALCRIELKDYEQADAEMSDMLSKWKNFFRAYMVKAQIALERKDTLNGIRWMDSLLVHNAKETAAWSFKGRYALQKEDFIAADSFLTKAIQLSPDNHENYVARALARNGRNRFGDAIADYDKAIELVPQHFVAHYNRGLLRALVGDANRAIDDFDFVLKIEPDNVPAIFNRAQLKEQTGDFRGAIADYSFLLNAYPDFTYGYMARANCRRKIGDTKGALNDESKVARSQLDLIFGRKRRTPIKKVRQLSDHSLENYQQLVEDNPETPHRLIDQLFGKVQNRPTEKELLPPFTLSFVPEQTKNRQSIYFMSEIEELNSLHFTKYRMEMTTEPDHNAFAQSQTSLQELSRYDNERQNAKLYLLRSALNRAVYDYSAAIQDVREAIRLDSLSLSAWLQYAVLAADIQRSGNSNAETAVNIPELYSHALRLSSQNACIYYNRGCYFAQMKNEKAAEADFSKAIELDNRMAEAYYNRAVLHLLSGESEKAIPDLSKAGELGLYKAYNLIKQNRQGKK